ncbi:MAG: alpha-mannosidase [Candidatus Hydrogenedentes bacterium]|nr:alpha-mannosidase [Candidatus Hydrogenedentota bacterium]
MLPPKAEEKIKKRLERLATWRYEKLSDVPIEYAETMEHFRRPPESLRFKPAPPGTVWGTHWSTTWFRGTIDIPKHCKGRRIYYRHVSPTDKLLWVDGDAFSGMNHKHEEVLLLKYARGGERFRFYVEAYTGHPIPGESPYTEGMFTHQFTAFDPGTPPPLTVKASELLAEREQTTGLYYDAMVLSSIVIVLDKNSLRRARLLEGLNKALDLVSFHWTTEEELESSARAARKWLAPLLAAKNAPTTPTVGLAGHCHIDIGWLWPVQESIRKAAKSFSSVLNLMDDYSDLRFQQSQPILYDMIERHYPDLLPKIKKRVKEGRWEPNGGMWVEADCNLTGSESLVRQFLEGRKKTLALFGYKGDTLWLPDVFGYSAALPQILKQCEIVNFVTSKINWSDTNRFPYDTFWWEGIDGTQVFTHYINTTGAYHGYNALVNPETSQITWNEVRLKEVQDCSLSSVGYGDGGGGPTREMCEQARRMGDTEGCIKTEFVNVSQFLKQMRTQDIERPRWVGELYLEYHRGTYTSQARTKRFNRKLEFLLREVELFGVLAMAHGHEYPAAELERIWRVVLTNQFHDIIPGSAIRRVYEVAEAEYAAAQEALLALRADIFDALAESLVPDSEGEAFLMANALSWDRRELVHVETGAFNAACDIEGNYLPCQPTSTGVVVEVSAGPLGVGAIALRHREPVTASPFVHGGKFLESPHYTIAFDKAGRITQLLDKAAQRNIVAEGKTLNGFYTAEHLPIYWDAWDIDRYYRDNLKLEEGLISRDVISDGPLFTTIRSKWKIGRASSLVQDMTLYATSRRIDFRTTVDWHEQQTLLKAGFHLNVHSQVLKGEIQFGHTDRNMHSNTSWDQARFEVCAHKWVDLSEGDYGVALLNDCKYGHGTLDNMLSLTLLKSSIAPDHEADLGKHEFTYALLPHTGPFSVETVVRSAYELNSPITVHRITKAKGSEVGAEFCRVDHPNIVIEAVKKAEEDNAIIVRLYEAGKTRGSATLRFSRTVRKATECNLMEEQDQAVKLKGDAIHFDFKPFEIKSFKVYLR